MTHQDLLNWVTLDVLQSRRVKALKEIINLHGPVKTKKGTDYRIHCGTCIVAKKSGGWENRVYPCPTLKLIIREIYNG